MIIDRDIPVPELRPYREKVALTIRKPVRELTLADSGIMTDVDPLVYLREERGEK